MEIISIIITISGLYCGSSATLIYIGHQILD